MTTIRLIPPPSTRPVAIDTRFLPLIDVTCAINLHIASNIKFRYDINRPFCPPNEVEPLQYQTSRTKLEVAINKGKKLCSGSF